MIEAGFRAARGDGEIDARVVEHPFGIVRLGNGRLCRKKGAVKADRLREIIDGDVNVQALHGAGRVALWACSGVGRGVSNASGGSRDRMFMAVFSIGEEFFAIVSH